MGYSFIREIDEDTEMDKAEITDKSTLIESQTSVEWTDISTNQNKLDNPESAESGTTIEDSATITNRILSRSGPSLTVETDMLTATLVGIPKVSILDFVYAHHRSTVVNAGATRFCAMFDVKNTSNVPIRWQSQRTKFIGDNSYTYGQSHVPLDSTTLAPGCHTKQITIEPNYRARIVTPAEQLPQGVDIKKVIHTVRSTTDEPKQRLVFTL